MRHQVNLSLSGMEEHFILIQMVLQNIKKEMDKIKNEEPEMEPEMEEEEPEEVEERVFNHLQQQRNNQRKQFQPSDLYETLWFLLIIHISKVILYSLKSFISFYSPFFAGKRLLSESMNPLLRNNQLRNQRCVQTDGYRLLYSAVDVAHIDYIICDDVTIFTFCQMKIKTNADIVQVHVFFSSDGSMDFFTEQSTRRDYPFHSSRY